MRQEAVGQYLGREVWVATRSSLFSEVAPGFLAHASVLFWLPTERDLGVFRIHLQDLVIGAPLVVFVAGPQAKNAFDCLLEFLADRAPNISQIMTRSRDDSLAECIEELLQATWPSEDRFDDWTTCLIVTDDAEVDHARRAAVEALCER